MLGHLLEAQPGHERARPAVVEGRHLLRLRRAALLWCHATRLLLLSRYAWHTTKPPPPGAGTAAEQRLASLPDVSRTGEAAVGPRPFRPPTSWPPPGVPPAIAT